MALKQETAFVDNPADALIDHDFRRDFSGQPLHIGAGDAGLGKSVISQVFLASHWHIPLPRI
jgi:hypothetical protein